MTMRTTLRELEQVAVRSPSILLGAFVAAGIFVAVLGWIINHNNTVDSQEAYQDRIAACERGNVVREIVFSNTRAAVVENKGLPIRSVYKGNVEAMRNTPGANPRTGAVDCQAVIQEP